MYPGKNAAHTAPTKGLESIKALIAITFQCGKNALPLYCEMNTMLFLQGEESIIQPAHYSPHL